MPHIFKSPQDLLSAVGQQFGPTDWITIDQAKIDKFAEATDDRQWIHVDQARAKTGPFGTTIAHGFLTLALINVFLPQLMTIEGITMEINYGVNKVRFPAVVAAGSRVRARCELAAAETSNTGAIQTIRRVTVEIDGGAKPACVAEAVSLFYPA